MLDGLQTMDSHQPVFLNVSTANLLLINLDRVYKPVSWSKSPRIRAHIRITRTCQARTAPTRPHTSGPLLSVSFLLLQNGSVVHTSPQNVVSNTIFSFAKNESILHELPPLNATIGNPQFPVTGAPAVISLGMLPRGKNQTYTPELSHCMA